jgi:hypothetical protein
MHNQELLASTISMRNTKDREQLQAEKISLRLIRKAILRDIIECLYRFEQITVNETWNDHEQDGSHLASNWATTAQNEFRQQRDLWDRLMHYESASDGDASDCSVSVRARIETRCIYFHKPKAMLKEF